MNEGRKLLMSDIQINEVDKMEYARVLASLEREGEQYVLLIAKDLTEVEKTKVFSELEDDLTSGRRSESWDEIVDRSLWAFMRDNSGYVTSIAV